MFFKKFDEPEEQITETEENFRLILDIVKGLDRTEFKRFQQALELAWSGYDKLLRVQTREDKANKDIAEAESNLEMFE